MNWPAFRRGFARGFTLNAAAWPDLIHDIRTAIKAARDTFARCRWLRQHGNPDNCPF